MPDLQHRQQKIQTKRKQTPRRDFVREICSWYPLNLYKYQGLISRYPNNGRNGNIVANHQFKQDNYTIEDYDNNKGLFYSLQKVFQSTEKKALPDWYDNENADFVDCAFGVKNGYLSFGVGINAENIFYSAASFNTITNIYNSIGINSFCDNIYYCRLISQSYNIFFSQNIHDSNNIWYSYNMIGCHECIACNDLENQSYYIENTPYEKTEYFRIKSSYQEKYKYKVPSFTTMRNYSCHECKSVGSRNCDSIESGYFLNEIKDGRNIILGFTACEKMYDCIQIGHNSKYFYGVCDAGTNGEHIYCSAWIGSSSFIYYCINLESCSFCLGCVGLKNKSYCILNKQYSKEERYEKVDEIFGQMEKDGTLGEFFPGSMNPFYFNDTAAYLIDPSFTKEEVTKLGYLRRDEPIKVDNPVGSRLVLTSELDQYEGRHDNQRRIDPEILNVIIQDEAGNVYRIIKMEYDFLMKHGLPLPRKHRLERMKENFKINS